ncbi:hypothetical protein PPYR_14051 [Photinus pyralis]|uniref:AB hydrolase-1 domain-containing protein n=1 Tax=Photinus pyralis TaxID=7054 RepID=A0A5N4A442_PHOPY|nr:hypothetical protein PPYR_14051 [Photinus pyralis]
MSSKRCCLICVLLVLAVLVIAFLSVFVGFPITFMLSIEIQRLFLFEPVTGNRHEFNLSGVVPGGRNFYVTVNEDITLGVWHLLPQALLNVTQDDGEEALAKGDYPVLFHCHGNGGNRLYHLDVYLRLTKFFHVVGFDYRSYGDSTDAPLTEEGLVQDTVELYKWLRNRTTADIYVWGHSMGTAVSTLTVSRLRNLNIVPAGLILESPYTTLREEAVLFPPAKAMLWLPWFNSTILDPIWNNGFRFEISAHISNVDCPVMILHAKDDEIIPYQLAVKLVRIGNKKRVNEVQGNITFHLFPKNDHYGHNDIYLAPQLPEYIRSHIDTCNEYNKGKG